MKNEVWIPMVLGIAVPLVIGAVAFGVVKNGVLNNTEAIAANVIGRRSQWVQIKENSDKVANNKTNTAVIKQQVTSIQRSVDRIENGQKDIAKAIQRMIENSRER